MEGLPPWIALSGLDLHIAPKTAPETAPQSADWTPLLRDRLETIIHNLNRKFYNNFLIGNMFGELRIPPKNSVKIGPHGTTTVDEEKQQRCFEGQKIWAHSLSAAIGR